MSYDEHGRTAREFLDASDRKFSDGDRLQASEKLWGAATHAVMAAAVRRDWNCRTHRALKNAVESLAAESGDDALRAGFLAAEKFHKNFYHDEMEDFEIEADRPVVHRFVNRVLASLEPAER